MSYFKRMSIEDTDGNPIMIETIDNNKYLGTTILQDVHASTTNELYAAIGDPAAAAVGPGETKNLTSGGIFTGTSQSSLGVASAQINLKTDQNCTVYVDQSMDNVNWDITDSYTYYYSDGGQYWTVQMTASYVRIRVMNDGAISTTYIRIQTAMCPVVEAIPRSLSSKGNLKTAINEMLGTFGTQVLSTPMGEMRTSNHVRLVGTAFNGTTFDTNFWTITSSSGTGTATLASGQLTIATGATANSTIVVNSIRQGRYIGGTANYYRAVVRAPSVTGTNVRRWGAYDANDGFFFTHNGTTLSLVCRKATVDTNTISSGSFNGEAGNTYTLNTNVHTYEIYWTNSSAWFMIDGIIIHKFSGSTTPLTSTTTLKIGMECINSSGNTNDNTLEIRVASIQRLGDLSSESQYRNITTATSTTCKYGAGKIHKICLNSPSQQAGIITVYDNTTNTGTIMATLQWTSNNSQLPQAINYDMPFSTGLTINTSQATNITVVYE